MGVLGELFPGPKIADEAGETGDGERWRLGPIDLAGNTVRLHRTPGPRAEDAGAEDAGAEDAGAEDAGAEDAGAEDAGAEDAGAEDTAAGAEGGDAPTGDPAPHV